MFDHKNDELVMNLKIDDYSIQYVLYTFILDLSTLHEL